MTHWPARRCAHQSTTFEVMRSPPTHVNAHINASSHTLSWEIRGMISSDMRESCRTFEVMWSLPSHINASSYTLGWDIREIVYSHLSESCRIFEVMRSPPWHLNKSFGMCVYVYVASNHAHMDTRTLWISRATSGYVMPRMIQSCDTWIK